MSHKVIIGRDLTINGLWQQWSEGEVYPKQETKTDQCLERFNTSCLGCMTDQLLDVGATNGMDQCANLTKQIVLHLVPESA